MSNLSNSRRVLAERPTITAEPPSSTNVVDIGQANKTVTQFDHQGIDLKQILQSLVRTACLCLLLGGLLLFAG